MSSVSFAVGEMVVDSEEQPVTPSVVVALPMSPASEWLTYGGTTVAHDNPGYPATASIVIVVDAADVGDYLADWDAETSLSRTALDEAGIYYEAIPAPRLTSIKSNEVADNTADATDTA